MQSEFSCSRLTLNNFPKLKYNLLTFNSVGVTVKGRNIPSGRLNMYIDTMILITVDMNAKPAIILSDKSRKHSIIPFWSYGEISNIKLTLCFRDELLTGVFNCSFLHNSELVAAPGSALTSTRLSRYQLLSWPPCHVTTTVVICSSLALWFTLCHITDSCVST